MSLYTYSILSNLYLVAGPTLLFSFLASCLTILGVTTKLWAKLPKVSYLFYGVVIVCIVILVVVPNPDMLKVMLGADVLANFSSSEAGSIILNESAQLTIETIRSLKEGLLLRE